MSDVNHGKKKRPAKHTFGQNVSVMWSNFVWKMQDSIFGHMSSIGGLLLASGPFVMLLLGEYTYANRGYWAIGGEVILPFVFVIAGFMLKSYARVSSTDHSDIPVPYDRFTEVDYDSGQVDVESRRLQEMILYMADLEDWFYRNGYYIEKNYTK